MRKTLLALTAACLLVMTAAAVPLAGRQQSADPRVVSLLDQAELSRAGGRMGEAHARVDEAAALAEKIGDRVGIAMSHRLRGTLLLSAGMAGEAFGSHERALAAFEALGNKPGMASALSGLAAAASALGQPDKVRDYGDRGLKLFTEVGDDLGRAYLLVTLMRGGDSAEERARIDEVRRTAERLGDDRLRGEVFKIEGSWHFNAGRYVEAKTSYEAAITALEKAGSVLTLAATYVSLGRVYRAHGDYEGALARYQRAIALLEPTRDRFSLAEALNASAIALGLLNRQRDALAAYERGLAVARESGNQRLIDFIEGNLAGGLFTAGDFVRAIPALEAIIAKKPEPYILGFRYATLAKALGRAGRAAEAIAPSTESVRIARELKDVDNLSFRLDDRSRLFATAGRLEEALADSREAISIVEGIRARLVPVDFLKRGYNERTQSGFQNVVDLLSRLGRGSEAIEFAEQGRARAFLDLMAARESNDVTLGTRGGATTPAPGARADLASASIGQPLDVAGIRDIATRLHSTIVAYWVNDEATLVWVIRPGAEPMHVRLPVTREKLAALVAATTALLRADAKPVPSRAANTVATSAASVDDLTALPMRGLGLLALSRDDKAAWRELYRTLIEPVAAQLPARGGRVTIVPHGLLFQLSFAALQNGAGRYLLEDYELHYAPAISALDFTGRRQQVVAANRAGPWAIVGNPTALPVVGDGPLPPLPGAAREIDAIAGLAPKGKAIRLEGARADEASLVEVIDASHPSLLHFATHGFVFDDPRQAPFLALHRRGTTDAEDGKLTLDEVYGLRLATDLVVLSACRTGSGQVSSDGILGLTRGFFYAGSPSVVATFWDVTDETAATLMSAFYRGYAKAHAKGSSLRAAQLALISDLRGGKVIVTAGGRRVTLPEHPLLWAAFFLSGEP